MPKNNSAKKAQAQYKNKYKQLRSFVDFKIDLRQKMSKGQKALITKYYNELMRVTNNKPYAIQVYRSRNKTRLKKVQALGGQNTKLSHFKVAFVPKNTEHQKIKFDKKGDPFLQSAYVKETYIPLDPLRLATENNIDYVNDVIKNRGENSFSIQAGDHQIKATFSKDTVAEKVSKLCNDYSNKESNHYFANWLGGLFANQFTNQASLVEYKEAKRAAQIKKDRSAKTRISKKTIKLFYWYDRKAQTVFLTKTDTPPNKHCEPITRREYERFTKTGEI